MVCKEPSWIALEFGKLILTLMSLREKVSEQAKYSQQLCLPASQGNQQGNTNRHVFD